LDRATFGERSATATIARLTAPTTATMADRALSMAIWIAYVEQRRGSIAASVALRGRVMRIAVKMRDQGSTEFSTRGGTGLFKMAAFGFAVPSGDYRVNSVDAAPDRYARWLDRHGFRREADWVRYQNGRMRLDQARVYSWPEDGIERSWIGGMALFVEVILITLAALLVAYFRSRRPFSRFPPAPRRDPALWGAACALLAVGMLAPILGYGPARRYALVGVAVLLAACSLGRVRAPLPLLRALVTTALLLIAAALLSIGLVENAACFLDNRTDYFSYVREGFGPVAVVELAIIFTVPIDLIVGYLALRSRRAHIPAAAGIVCGFGRMALLTAAFLLSAYVIDVVRLAPLEAEGRRAIASADRDPRGVLFDPYAPGCMCLDQEGP
jgi:hypothetical protein